MTATKKSSASKPGLRLARPAPTSKRSTLEWGKGASAPVPADAWKERLTLDHRGQLTRDVGNVVAILDGSPEWHGVFAWDEFCSLVQVRRRPPFHDDCTLRSSFESGPAPLSGEDMRPRPLSDSDLRALRVWLGRECGLQVSRDDVFDGVILAAQRNAFHPVQAYLLSTHWDRQQRMTRWLTDYLGVEHSEYSSLVGEMFLLQAVHRVFAPGSKADYTLVLEGAQGAGKSSALAILGGPWFLDTDIDLSSKDALLALNGRWIVEFSELASIERVSAERLKSFLSRQTDVFRPPYGRTPIDVPRQCVFAATTNADEYLLDDTGGRRFWPVRVGDVKLAELRTVRDQLWAEALERYVERVKAWPTAEEQRAWFAPQQAQRIVGDLWEEPVREWLAKQTLHHNWQGHVTAPQVLEMALSIPPHMQDHRTSRRLTRVLTRLGWTKHRLNARKGASLGASWGWFPDEVPRVPSRSDST